MSLYEIEIKSLLGTKDKADVLSQKIAKKGGKLISKNKQLNHYFVLTDVAKFEAILLPQVSDKDKFKQILEKGRDFSVRTREVLGKVILVIKASLGEGTSANAVSRMEFEAQINLSLEELDKLLLSAGLEYQAKWSRAREEYKLGETNICIDRNAGYGYLAEFERVVPEGSPVDGIKQELIHLMDEFEAEELKQDRLERMFEYYNKHWQDYYGTDKVFNID